MEFLSLFNETIKDYSDVKLSHLTGIERTRLNRIKNGHAKIKFDELKNIATVLMLSDESKQMLFDSFLMEKVGKDKYLSRKITKEFFRDLCIDFNSNLEKFKSFNLQTETHFNLPKETTVINGEASVDLAVSLTLELALSNKNKIEIISSPSHEVLFSQLFNVLSKENGITIDHILSLMPSDKLSEPYSYNINIAKTVYPLFMLNGNYCAYYLYDYSDINALMPYYIITDSISVNISKNFNSAIITQDKDIINLHRELFREQKVRSLKLVNNIQTPEEYLKSYCEFLTRTNLLDEKPLFYSVDYEPCILPYLDISELNGVLQNVCASQKLIELTNNYLHNLHPNFFNEKQISFFTKAGLNYFINTGKISEIPDCFAVELTKDRRKELLVQLLTHIKSGENTAKEYRLINDELLSIPYGFRFLGYGSQDDHLFFLSNKKNGLQSIFDLSNINILSSVFDFIESLPETDTVLTRNQTIEYLEAAINRI